MTCKKLLFFSILWFIAITGFTQETHGNYGKKYIDTTFPKPGGNYFFLELNVLPSKKLANDINQVALRKFSDREYIVDKDKFLALRLPAKFTSHFTPANSLWKLPTSTQQITGSKPNEVNRFLIQLANSANIEQLHQSYPELQQKIYFIPGQKIISLATDYTTIVKYFLNNDNVTGIELVGSPKEELATPGFDLSANKVNVVHSRYPRINGSGKHVSIKEQYYDTTDIDIKGRYEPSPLAASTVTNHANFIATIIAGAGNSIWYAKGAAWGAGISSSSFEQVLPDPDNYYLEKKISVQNHSYGTVIDNSYGLAAVAFDNSSNLNQELLHVFSSGNSGTSASSSGTYSGMAGFANITGNFKMAKNGIVVGAVDSLGNLAPLSSRGPAYDGRVKPEIVAFQKSGTSDAAAIVSGTTLLLQQYYQEKHSSILPSALAKAILVNSADDLNNPGPDYSSGYGNMNAGKAMDIITYNQLFSDEVTPGSTRSFQLSVPPNIAQLKITLCWNDTAALAQAPKALVNDLDLEVALPRTGETWKPWVLNPYPNVDSLNSLPQRKRDSLNNLEQVTVQDPVAGDYLINVHGFDMVASSQKFYLAYSFDTSNYFKWQRLTDSDFAEGGKPAILRWENSFPGSGDIAFSYLSNTWIPLGTAELSKNYFYWIPPDTIAEAVLRIAIGNTFFYSDTFLISKLLNPKIGFVCADSILLYWENVKNVAQYQVYQLGEKYMEPLLKVNDTAVTIPQNLLADRYLAVAPVLPGGRIAPKSYALNYTLQGAGCFINSFLVNGDGNIAHLVLELGSINNIVSIAFEKLTANGFVTIYNTPVNGQLQFVYDFIPLTTGISIFRAKIVLSTGQIIYSKQESVGYAAPGKYLLYPIPATAGSGLTVFTTLPEGEIFVLTDVAGRVIMRKELQIPYEHINTSSLQKGIYFYCILKAGIKAASGKLILL